MLDYFLARGNFQAISREGQEIIKNITQCKTVKYTFFFFFCYQFLHGLNKHDMLISEL